jgi:hypothetical protein
VVVVLVVVVVNAFELESTRMGCSRIDSLFLSDENNSLYL